jgi:hypothetical protein
MVEGFAGIIPGKAPHLLKILVPRSILNGPALRKRRLLNAAWFIGKKVLRNSQSCNFSFVPLKEIIPCRLNGYISHLAYTVECQQSFDTPVD